jgi:hypothetical protein
LVVYQVARKMVIETKRRGKEMEPGRPLGMVGPLKGNRQEIEL